MKDLKAQKWLPFENVHTATSVLPLKTSMWHDTL